MGGWWSKGILGFRFGPNLGLETEARTKLNNLWYLVPNIRILKYLNFFVLHCIIFKTSWGWAGPSSAQIKSAAYKLTDSCKGGYSNWKGSSKFWMKLIWSLVTTGAQKKKILRWVDLLVFVVQSGWMSLYVTSIFNYAAQMGPKTTPSPSFSSPLPSNHAQWVTPPTNQMGLTC